MIVKTYVLLEFFGFFQEKVDAFSSLIRSRSHMRSVLSNWKTRDGSIILTTQTEKITIGENCYVWRDWKLKISKTKIADDNSDDWYYDYGDDENFLEDQDDYSYYNDGEPSWEWETYEKSTHIFFPPQTSFQFDKGENQRPNTIIHFIGGTLFGSYPLQFYKSFLESVAKKSNSIIVATSVPVVLSSNPLNHFAITKEISRNFRDAYRYVISDEYGKTSANQMKIVGMGHSLGSRLLAILNTSQKCKRIAFKRDGNVFISFNNYNAVESVPGIKNLSKGIIEETDNDEGHNFRDQRRKYPDDRFDETEIGLSDVISAVTEGLQDQMSLFKTIITPDFVKSDLEFQPTPSQIWKGLQTNYNVRKTLVVQFDNDNIDQSSRFANSIVESLTNREGHLTVNTTNTEITNIDSNSSVNNITSHVRFCRLQGTHLSPVSYSDTIFLKAIKRTPFIDQILSEAIQEESAYQPISNSKQNKGQKKVLEQLTDSIGRYVTDIIK